MSTPNAVLSALAEQLPKLAGRSDWTRTDVLLSAQEMLDLLLMLAGRKPVYLARAFAPPGWPAFLRSVAKQHRVTLLEGPMWTAINPFADAPDWLRDTIGASWASSPGQATYLTRTPALAQEIAAINAGGGSPSIEREAALLGYPLCCVEHHYVKYKRISEILTHAYRREGGNDPLVLRQLVEDDTKINLSDDESEMLSELRNLRVYAYSSVNACPNCAKDHDSLAKQQAAENEDFAWMISPSLAGMILRAKEQHAQDYI